MNTIIWIFQGLLSVFFLMPAYTKLTSSKEKLVEKHMLKPEQSINSSRSIGLMELFGTMGIIVPQLTGIAKILTPTAAPGFALIMLGAFFIHLKKKDYKTLTLFLLCLHYR